MDPSLTNSESTDLTIESNTGNEKILDAAMDSSDDVMSFLDNAIKKSKNLNRNKLQIELEKCMSTLNEYKNECVNYKNTIEQLTKEKTLHMECSEKLKNEVQKLNSLNDDLNKQNENHKNSINNEKNINSNLKVSYETQIQKLNKTNDELNMKLEEHSTTNNDLQVKYNELHKRYTDLTTLYSKQTSELEMSRKNIKHLNDELNTACSNNKTLHDEINSIKNEAVNYITQIEQLKELAIVARSVPVITPTEPTVKVRGTPVTTKAPRPKGTRGLRVSNRQSNRPLNN
jgi:chromosome segregation ATPase